LAGPRDKMGLSAGGRRAYAYAMRRIFSIVLAVGWALWFGGIVALFLFVTTLFGVDRAAGLPKGQGIAPEAAPHLFHAFERYQLILAAACLVAAVALRIMTKAGVFAAVFLLLSLATVGAVVEPMFISAKLRALGEAGQRGGVEFMRWHGYSMIVYVAQAAALLIAGLILPTALGKAKAPVSA
jgi:hypothetical protein